MIIIIVMCRSGLKPGRVIRVTFCPGQAGLTCFISYPGSYIESRALMMASGSGDDGSVFSNSAQDVSNLVIDGDRIQKKVEHGSNFESC